MALEPELAQLFLETVTIEAWTGQSTTGAPTYAAPVNVPARIEMKSLLVRMRDGREAAARGRAFLGITDPAYVPSITDRLTLPSEYTPNRTPPILDVQPEFDDVNLHHVILVLG